MPAGRYWGIAGRKRLPVDLYTRQLDWRSFVRVRRVLWKWSLVNAVGTGRKAEYTGIMRYVSGEFALRLLEYAGHQSAATLPGKV